jgi:hypothetical protein
MNSCKFGWVIVIVTVSIVCAFETLLIIAEVLK